MIAVSEKWKEYALNGGVFHVLARLINGTSYLELTDTDFMEGAVAFEDATSPDDALAIGCVVTNTFSATLNNFDGKFNSFNFENSVIMVKFGAEYEDGTSEYIYRGTYRVEAPLSLGTTIEITGYDYTELLNVRFTGKYRNPDTSKTETIKYPVEASKLVIGLCDYVGLSMQSTGWKLPYFSVPKFSYDETATIRQVIGWVLQCCGGYARMGHMGGADYLVCEWYSNPWGISDSFDGGEFSPWEQVSSFNGGTMWSGGEEADGGTLTPVPRDLTQTTINATVNTQDITITGARAYVYGTVDTPVYRTEGTEGYVVEIKENPMIKASNVDEVAKNVYKMCGGMTFAVFNANVFTSPDIEAGEYCIIADYLGNERTSVISNFNYSISGASSVSINAETPELASQSFVDETQSTINTAVKRTYEYINTEKLSADVIEGGTLTLGGENNVNGSLRILNAKGEQIGSWDNTGAEIVGKLYMTGGSMQIETEDSAYNYITLTYNENEVSSQTTLDVAGIHCKETGYVSDAEFTLSSYRGNGMATGNEDGVFASFGGDTFGEAYLSNASGTLTISLVGSSGKITCVSLTQTSKEEFKENIVPFGDRGVTTKRLLKASPKPTAIDLVNSTDIYEYNYKGIEADSKHYGVIIDGDYRCCNEIKNEDGVDTYSMVSILWQAVKELNTKVEELNEANIISNQGDTGQFSASAE